jgi:integrase
LTAQRLGETRKARWDDIEGGTLIIPSKNAKNDRMNRVPLSDPALNVLEELKEINGESDFVFCSPSPAKENEPIRWVTDATKRIREECGFYFRLHDLRRTAASGMSRLGVDRVTISKVLNHKSADGSVTAVYDRYEREKEKREALKKWGEQIASLTPEVGNE